MILFRLLFALQTSEVANVRMGIKSYVLITVVNGKQSLNKAVAKRGLLVLHHTLALASGVEPDGD